MATANDKPVENAPATVEPSSNAGTKVKTVWPTTTFRVESVPEITSAGTLLTATQLKAAQEAAKASGVGLVVEDKEGGSK